jgi:hypothetical protein
MTTPASASFGGLPLFIREGEDALKLADQQIVFGV